jgi:hypothetical protein
MAQSHPTTDPSVTSDEDIPWLRMMLAVIRLQLSEAVS